MTDNPELAPADLILAVDAGGTKTVAWLAQSSGESPPRVLGRGRATGGNPLSVGFREATRAIAEAIELARRETHQPDARVARAVLSVAGTAELQLQKQLTDWAHERGIADRVAVVSDVLPVLAAGTDACCGIALVAGTGSVAFGRAADGRTALVGGWGFLLGDEGSGYAIGRAAVRSTLRELESGAAPQQPMARAALDAFGVGSAAELKSAIYRSADPRAAIAGIAARILELAEQRDPSASAIVDAAACDLADLVIRAAEAAGLSARPVALAAAGGIIVGSKRLLDRLMTELKQKGHQCDCRIVAEPIEGCLRLADAEFAGLAVEWT